MIHAFASRHVIAALACLQGLVPDQSGMAAEIAGLSIEAVGHRPVEPPGAGVLPLRFTACTGAGPHCLCATLDKTRLIWHRGSDVAYLLASRMSSEQPLLCAVGHFHLGHLRVPAFQGGSSRP